MKTFVVFVLLSTLALGLVSRGLPKLAGFLASPEVPADKGNLAMGWKAVTGKIALEALKEVDPSFRPTEPMAAARQMMAEHVAALETSTDVCVHAAAPAANPSVRQWRDDRGRTVLAEYVGRYDGMVRLRLASGRMADFPQWRLCGADQAWLADKPAKMVAEPVIVVSIVN